MSGQSHIEPVAVAQMVDAFITGEIEEAHRYDNREVLDESGAYGLHALAASVYAKGFEEGAAAQSWKDNAQRRRERDAARRAKETEDGGGA
jgi:hypothetical protein